MKVTVLTDNTKSWFIPYGRGLVRKLKEQGHDSLYVHDRNNIPRGDVCFLLSCSNIIGEVFLRRNQHNIVVHASNLPEGKGFAPLQWQVLEGKNDIVITLFEAVKDLDAGPYYIKSRLKFDGTELHDELRRKLAEKIIEMCMEFIEKRHQLIAIPQTGKETFYRKRNVKDDELDINKTIEEQFNHFRIANNEQFPLYFFFKGQKYIIKIYKDEPFQ